MYSIGALSQASGVKVPTIRFYEEGGLIPAPARSEGGQRRYDPAALERLLFIRHARDLGFGMEAVRALLELADHPDRSCAEAHAIAAAHLGEVRARIARLRGLEAELVRLLACPPTGLAGECGILGALSDHSDCGPDDHAPAPIPNVSATTGRT